MTVLDDCPDNSLRSRFKFYFKQVVPSRHKKKEDSGHKVRTSSVRVQAVIGDKTAKDELEELKRTFSPPLMPRVRPYPLRISHQSEDNLADMSDNIGSTGSSYSSGYDDTLIDGDLMETRSVPDIQMSGLNNLNNLNTFSPPPSESGFMLRMYNSQESLSPSNCSESLAPSNSSEFKRSASSVFEGMGGVDTIEWDCRENKEQILFLSHRNKYLEEECQRLQSQMEETDEIFRQMDGKLDQYKKEITRITAQRDDKFDIMRNENKELELSTLRLREQRLETENRLCLMEEEKNALGIQLQELKQQLSAAQDEQTRLTENNADLFRRLDNRQVEFEDLEGIYNVGTEMSMETQSKLDEIMNENLELKNTVQRLKLDNQSLTVAVTNASGEISRWRQQCPLTPLSDEAADVFSQTCSSVVSPMKHYNPPQSNDEEGEALGDVLNLDCDLNHSLYEQQVTEIDCLEDINQKLRERNESLNQELRDMKDLIYVVAPQHYIDDDNAGVEFNNRPLEITYRFIPPEGSITEEGVKESLILNQNELTICPGLTIPPLEKEDDLSFPPTSSTPTIFSYDDDDSGVASQHSSNEQLNCVNCCLREPERDLLRKELAKRQLKQEELEQQILDLHKQRTVTNDEEERGYSWLIHLSAFLILLILALALLPLFQRKCRYNYLSWGDMFSFDVQHVRSTSRRLPVM